MDHLKLLVLASILRCGPGKVGFFERGRGFLKFRWGGVDQKGVVKNYGGGDGLGHWHG